MNSAGISHSHDDEAAQYDRQASEHGWHGYEALFGLMYEFVKPGETLLDIGIGTGLGSFLFHKIGLQVSGFDSSREMLEMCKSKGFAAQLVRHDLQQVPYPYGPNSFDHATAIAVLNFFANPAPVFQETARIVRPQGIFAFTVEEQKPGQETDYVIRTHGGSGRPNEATAVTMFRHSDAHIRHLLAGNGFTLLKDFEFLADRNAGEGRSIYFKLYVAQKGERA
jgi:predicted TPR repeat methyltransferase